jgi:hypothetical protein
MAHRLQTPEGKALYAKGKCTPEPVFGVIKSAMGFRQFLLRGLENVQGGWSLVTMALECEADVRPEGRLRGGSSACTWPDAQPCWMGPPSRRCSATQSDRLLGRLR